MSGHGKQVCPHGNVVRRCKCGHQDVITVDECPKSCDQRGEVTVPPAGFGEKIIVLAVGPRDGMDMRRAIGEVKPGAVVRVATEVKDLWNVKGTEFVMTEAFRNLRTVRLIMAAEVATRDA